MLLKSTEAGVLSSSCNDVCHPTYTLWDLKNFGLYKYFYPGTTSTNHAALMQALLKGLAVLYMHLSPRVTVHFLSSKCCTPTQNIAGVVFTPYSQELIT